MKLIIQKFKNIDTNIFRVCISGLKFCFVLMLISVFILSLYNSLHN